MASCRGQWRIVASSLPSGLGSVRAALRAAAAPDARGTPDTPTRVSSRPACVKIFCGFIWPRRTLCAARPDSQPCQRRILRVQFFPHEIRRSHRPFQRVGWSPRRVAEHSRRHQALSSLQRFFAQAEELLRQEGPLAETLVREIWLQPSLMKADAESAATDRQGFADFFACARAAETISERPIQPLRLMPWGISGAVRSSGGWQGLSLRSCRVGQTQASPPLFGSRAQASGWNSGAPD
jgi:hypothetical protein